MNIKEYPFEEVLRMFDPAIKKQLVTLRLYKDHDEFYQIGCIALWNAYQQFDPDKGHFPSYAISFIRGRMMSHLSKETKFKERHSFATEEIIEFEPSTQGQIPLEKEMIEAYLWNLTDKEKRWVHKAIFLEMKSAELQTVFDLSRNSIYLLRKKTLKKLRDNALILNH
ncbi:RNA polymerase factor sigma-70 [Halalkalibacter krulwichiae]|uniref:RNA polymerase factor sigma-70 n=2 Tax=Halalkalibacter krulwichiae TaxID=199441 RepID=A0A1X9M8T6_9BACI|nr:RNA polymerase factor sigma-70 [Halalkalibacter krulwichiae]